MKRCAFLLSVGGACLLSFNFKSISGWAYCLMMGGCLCWITYALGNAWNAPLQWRAQLTKSGNWEIFLQSLGFLIINMNGIYHFA